MTWNLIFQFVMAQCFQGDRGSPILPLQEKQRAGFLPLGQESLVEPTVAHAQSSVLTTVHEMGRCPCQAPFQLEGPMNLCSPCHLD